MRNSILYLLFFNITIAISQKADHGYILSTMLPDKNSVYTKGLKWVDSNSVEFHDEKYNGYFYVSKFDLNGKKEWEVVVDRKNHEGTSVFHKHNDTLYALFSVGNIKDESSMHTSTNFLIKLDPLGKIVQENKISDSIPYPFNSVFFSDDFIYIIQYKNKVVCEKYDYNLNLVDSINNKSVISFLYGSTIFKGRKNYISIGPANNMDVIDKHVQNRTLGYYNYTSKQECIKKMSNGLSKEGEITITALPPDYSVFQTSFDNDVLYLLMWHREKFNNYKLLSYNVETDQIQLLTDTLTRTLFYFKALGDKEYVFVTAEMVKRYDAKGTKEEIPSILYYIKNNKVVSRLELAFDDAAKSFLIRDRKLLIFKNALDNNTMKVTICDYENGKILR